MPAAREDYLLRMIQQAAAALRRLREKLGGGGSAEEVAHDARAAIGELLGTRRELLDRLDAASAVQLMGDVRQVRLWIELLHARADALQAGGDLPLAQRLRVRADELGAKIAD